MIREFSKLSLILNYIYIYIEHIINDMSSATSFLFAYISDANWATSDNLLYIHQ